MSGNNVPGLSSNSSPAMANQVLQMIADIASQLQQSAQQDQGVGLGSSNLAMRSQSRQTRSSPLGNQRPKTKRNTPTSLERQGLFLGQSTRETPTRTTREAGPAFPKTFIILAKKFQTHARMKPTSSDLDELTDAGLGEVVVQLQDEDTASVVLAKLQVCCPLLKSLGGWVVMLKAVSTNSSSMEMISGKPILSGVELHRLHARVYVAPLKKDLVIPPKLSFCSVECDDCGEMIDSIYMMEHMDTCSGERSQSNVHALESGTSSATVHGIQSYSTHGTPSTSRFRAQSALASRSPTDSTSPTPSCSTSRSTSRTTSRTTSASASSPWQTSDPNVDLEKCEVCGDRVDYFLMLDHIESCSSSSRPIVPPSTSVSQALMDLNQPDDIESIQECELSPEPCVENDGCSLTLDHGGCIETTVASCSSMLSTGHELDDAKPSKSDTSLLGHIYETEAAMQKFEGFISKIKMTNGSNVLRLNRPYYVKAAVNASQATQFMASLLSKFVVVFKGEEGVDVGGVRRDFFSHLFHRFENLLIDNRAYMKGEGDTLSETEYAAGIFFGIAMVQEKIYHPAVIELLKSGGPKFVEGLNVFDNLGEFLNGDSSLHILFKRHPLTADGMIALLRRDANLDPNCEIIEKMNFLFICKFFKEISKGLISINTAGENQPMCLEDVLQFLTGKRIIAPGDDSVIQVEFIKSTEDGFRRPAVSTCAQKVTATLAEEYEVMRDVWIEAVAQLIIGFTLN